MYPINKQKKFFHSFRLITQTTLETQLLFRGLCVDEVYFVLKLDAVLMKRKTTPEQVELKPVGVTLPQFSIQRRDQNLSSLKYRLHLKNLSCSMLVRKYALSELQSLIDTIQRYITSEKNTQLPQTGFFQPASMNSSP